MSVSIQPAPLRLGPYELLQRIATGGMAEVYLARRVGPHGFQKILAVKRILPQLAHDPDFVAMFCDEARVAARLGHPNIVQVFDFGAANEENGEDLYMAMEYVDGTTGARLIRAAATNNEPIPLDITLQIALSVARALEHAHQAKDEDGNLLKLVHRDVSPGNVLIDRWGAVKLTDFGIVRAEEVERRTEAGQLKGKLGYMSPEQVVGRELDARSDLFTLGVVLAEMTILQPLFAGGSELDVLIRIRDADLKALDRSGVDIPEDVKAILYKTLSRDPWSRYPSAGAFAEALEDVIRRRRLHFSPSQLAAFCEKLGILEPLPEPGGPEGAPSKGPTAVLTEGAPERNERLTPLPPSERRRGDPAKEAAPAIYRVDDAGTITEPLSYPKMVELFATGGIKMGARIARESGEFRVQSAYPELARFVRSPALRWEPLFPPETEGRCPIVHGEMPARVFGLVLRKDTGVLVLADGEHKKKVYFVEGAPEYIASTDKRELLGEHLVAAGQVLRMEVDMALAMLPRFNGRLGDALVGLGVLRPVELFRAIHHQIQGRFNEVFTWTNGEMGFVRGARSQEETFPLGIDPLEMVVRGVRESFGIDEITELLKGREEEKLEPGASLPMRLGALHLPEREAGVLRAVDGKRSTRELVRDAVASGATVDEVKRAIFLGLASGVLRRVKPDA